MDETQRLTDRSMFTEFDQIVGTLLYMSPEQTEMSLDDIDTRSDVYALGVLLYELLTGSTPIERQMLKKVSFDRLIAAIRDEEPQRPSQRLSSIGDSATAISLKRQTDVRKLNLILKGDLDWIVMKSLSKDRTRRYESPVRMAEDIKRCLNNEAIYARPPSLRYQAFKTFKKHLLAIFSASVVLMTLIGGIITTTWQWNRARLASESNANLANRNLGLFNNAEDLRKVADANNTEAQNATKLAEERADEIEANLAKSNYFLAISRWDANQVGEAIQALEKVPEKHRHFEWKITKNEFEGSDLTCYGHNKFLSSVSFSPDGSKIAPGSADSTIKIWDSKNGSLLHSLKDHLQNVNSIAFSPDGKWIVSGSSDSTLKIWETQTGKEKVSLSGHEGSVTDVSICQDGNRIASGSTDKTIKIWNASTGQEILTLRGHAERVLCVAFSPDGRQQLVSGGFETTIRIWDVQSGTTLSTIDTPSTINYSMSYSPTGQQVVIAGNSPSFAGLDILDETMIKEFHGHTSGVPSVDYSPYGRHIVSGSLDGTIKVWQAESGAEIWTYKGHTSRVDAVSYSPDGKRIVSGAWDNSFKV